MINPIRAARNHARSVRGAFRTALVRGWTRTVRTWQDPPVDLLIAGVFGTLVGRCYLYVTAIISFITASMFAVAAVLLVVAVFDVGLHALTCKALIDWLRCQYSGAIAIAPDARPVYTMADGTVFRSATATV